jgi:predicted DNA-binding transcriptional regulator AlpA
VPTIPIEQQSPYPGGQRAAAAKTTVPDNQVDTSANAIRGPPRLWDRETTCAFFGGIDPSTLYRGMDTGRYPRPVLVSANVARWLGDECEAALDRMIAARDEPKPPSPRRGRKRGASAAAKAKTAAEIETA